jgi:hypothetical protein
MLSGPGFQDLNIWLSGPGFQALNARFQDLNLRTWVSGPRKLSILRSSYLFPVTFLCVQWSQTHARTDVVNLYIRYATPLLGNALEYISIQVTFVMQC